MLRSGVRGGGVSGEQLGLCAIRHPLKASGEAYVLLCAHAAMGMDGPFSGRPHRMTTSWQACGRCRASGIIAASNLAYLYFQQKGSAMSTMRKAYRTILTEHFPDTLTIQFGEQALVYRKRLWKLSDPETGETIEQGLRYGENPDQECALYELVNGNLVLGDCRFIEPGRGLVSSLTEQDMVQFGKHPGKINLTDVDNALNILKYLVDKPAAAVMKHNNPSGVALGASIAEACERAYMADRIAAMGGAVALSRACDVETAEFLSRCYVEVVAAPNYDGRAVDLLRQRKNLRIIRIARIDRLAEYRTTRFVDFKSLIDGGLMVQQSQVSRIQKPEDFKPAMAKHQGKTYTCRRQATPQELADLFFGWCVEMGVTSNSVLYAKDGATVAIGTGEQDRVGCAKIAVYKAYTKYADLLCFQRYGIPYAELELAVRAGKRPGREKEEIDDETRRAHGGLKGSVMVSDGFFPFRDSVDVAAAEGITAIAQPGGGMLDHEVIDACNEAEPPIAMVFTGQRAFKH